MANAIKKTTVTNNGTLTDSDIAYIEEMAAFYGITLDEAYQRFLSGNIDGLEIEDDELEEEY